MLAHPARHAAVLEVRDAIALDHHDSFMATGEPRPQRRERGTSVALFARVRPQHHEKARAAAAAMNVSLATYIERLLDRDEVDPTGCPLWWEDPQPPTQEELFDKTG